MRLCQTVKQNRLVLAVGESGDDTEQFTFLVGDACLHVRYLMVVDDFPGFGGEHVARKSTFQKRDIVLDTEGQCTMTVHRRRDSAIGECELGSALTYITAIEMLVLHRHRGFGIPFADFHQPTSVACRETVSLT